MSIEQEILEVISQIPAAIEKALLPFVERHGTHNQKTHGNRFGGYGVTKESLRRLKGDKEAREKYKQTARKRQGKPGRKGQQGGSQAATLKSIESKIRNQSYESAAVVDKNGKILLQKDGGKDYVSFSDDEVKLMRGASITHNHPGDNSFSPEDGVMLAMSGASEIRAVGKKWTHTLKPVSGEALNPDKVRRSVNALNSYVRSKFIKEINAGKMTIQQAEANHWHEVWTEGASRLGLEYSREAV